MVPLALRAELSGRTRRPLGHALPHTHPLELSMRIMRVGAGAILLALTVGCGNTAQGVKEDTAKAAENTAKAAEATTDVVGGAMLTASVKSAIIADPRVGAREINVDTDEARKTVTLNGTVTTDEQKKVSGEIAATKATGYTIVNNLAVRP
jgi:PBP1b-binding outer membrane lipoprotein LpoB